MVCNSKECNECGGRGFKTKPSTFITGMNKIIICENCEGTGIINEV